MIALIDAAVVLDQPLPVLETWPKQDLLSAPKAQRTLSPCARYAIAALETLNLDEMPQAMVCLSGPTGMMADVFEPARRLSSTGLLVGPDFVRRSRRIHPLTLVRSLQNQVPSALSQKFAIHGPVINSLESGTALVYLLPNIKIVLQRYDLVLLVLASAGERREERAKRSCFLGKTTHREGAFVFLLGKDGGLGELSLNTTELVGDGESTDEPRLGDPILDAGTTLLRCMIEKPDERVLNFWDPHGHCARALWKGH